MSLQAKPTVVVIARNEGANLRKTVQDLEDTLPGHGEIVVVDDGSSDGSADHLARRRGQVRLKRALGVGVARARNLGAAHARGDVLVFADAHIRLAAGWCQPLLDLLDDPGVGAAAPAVAGIRPRTQLGYGLTFQGPDLSVRWQRKRSSSPFAAPILPGCCHAMRKDTFEATGGWDEGMLHRGGVDNEYCVRLWLLGYRLLIAPQVEVRHLFRSKSPSPMRWDQYLHNHMRLAFLHLKPARVAKVVSAFRGFDEFGEAMLLLLGTNVAARRQYLAGRRRQDDDWFFERFRLRW